METKLTGDQIAPQSINRSHVSTTQTGLALPTRISASAGLSLTSTGADPGTGEITLSVENPLFSSTAQIAAYTGSSTTVQTADGKIYQRKVSSATVDNLYVLPVSGSTSDRFVLVNPSPLQPDYITVQGFTSDAIQRAIDLSLLIGVERIFCPPGTYVFTSTVQKLGTTKGLNLFAIPGTVVFSYAGLANQVPALYVQGGSGTMCQAVISGIRFLGDSLSVAIELDGVNGQLIQHCAFATNLVGVRFHNKSVDNFTEYCVVEHSTFELECICAVQYKRTDGTDSFNGTGLGEGTTVNYPGGALPVVQIDANCRPYNAPLKAQIWFHGSGALVKNDNGAPSYLTAHFVGLITLERFAGELVLGSGWRTIFTGGIQCFNDYVSAGSLLTASKVTYGGNAVVPLDINYTTRYSLTTGNTTFTTFASGGKFLVTLQLTGTDYDARYTFIITHQGYGGPGDLVLLESAELINTPAYQVSFDSDANGQLVVSCATYPATGIKAIVTYNQIFGGVFGNMPNGVF